MSESATYGTLHAGDVVLGDDDGQEWGVEYVARQRGTATPFAVGLIRHGARVTGYPEETTPVVVVRRADTSLEAGAYEMLAAAGLAPEVIAEGWSNVQE